MWWAARQRCHERRCLDAITRKELLLLHGQPSWHHGGAFATVQPLQQVTPPTWDISFSAGGNTDDHRTGLMLCACCQTWRWTCWFALQYVSTVACFCYSFRPFGSCRLNTLLHHSLQHQNRLKAESKKLIVSYVLLKFLLPLSCNSFSLLSAFLDIFEFIWFSHFLPLFL